MVCNVKVICLMIGIPILTGLVMGIVFCCIFNPEVFRLLGYACTENRAREAPDNGADAARASA